MAKEEWPDDPELLAAQEAVIDAQAALIRANDRLFRAQHAIRYRRAPFTSPFELTYFPTRTTNHTPKDQ